MTVLLSACGGSDSGGESGSGSSAKSGKSSPQPSRSAGHPGPGSRPALHLPAGAQNIFEDPELSSAAEDAVLADSAERIKSIDDAIFRGKVETEALRFYSEGAALISASEFIGRWVEAEHTWGGVTRYFDREVTFLGDGSAAVIYCADESDSYTIDGRTGELDHSSATRDSYVLYNTRLKKNREGIWKTVSVVSDRGHEKCQP